MSTLPPEAERAIDALNQWQADLPAAQAKRLTEARRLALAAPSAPRRSPPVWLAGAVAAGLALTLGVGVLLKPTAPATSNAIAMADDPNDTTADLEFLDEDLAPSLELAGLAPTR